MKNKTLGNAKHCRAFFCFIVASMEVRRHGEAIGGNLLFFLDRSNFCYGKSVKFTLVLPPSW